MAYPHAPKCLSPRLQPLRIRNARIKKLCTRVTTTYAENILATLDSPTENTRPTLTILCLCRADKETYVRIVLTKCIGILLSFVNMAAAVPPRATFSALYGDPTQWEAPNPDYATLSAYLGKGTAARAAATDVECRDGLAATAARSPVVLAFVTASDCDSIYVAHSLSLYPADIAAPCVLDGLLVGLVGDEPAVAFPVVLPQTFMTVTALAAVPDLVTLQGATMHGAAPPLFRSGPHAAGAAGTTNLRARRAMILPCDLSATALRNAPQDGRYTLLGFFNTFLQGALAGTAADVARIGPLVNWWRCASTDMAAGGATLVAGDLVAAATPTLQAKATAWAGRVSRELMTRLGSGGPGLTSVAFAHGVADLKATLEANQQANLEFERARKEKTFTDQHGEALAGLLHRWCGVTRDVDLPHVHTLILKSPKEKTYGILDNLFLQRTMMTSLGMTEGSAPRATTALVNEVFRSYKPVNSGTELGKGLSPFGMTMEGHEGFTQLSQAVRQAAAVEGGASVSLADADTLLASDSHFPSDVWMMVEKVNGWSVVIDVFHGVNHPIAVSVRNAVQVLGPQLQRLASSMGDDPQSGLELVCRVVYDMQQDYYLYMRHVSRGEACDVPTFSKLIDMVSSNRATSLTDLPKLWYAKPGCPKPTKLRLASAPAPAPSPSPSPARLAVGGAMVVNANADTKIMKRYTDHGATNITAMQGDRTVEKPKIDGKELCLAWALKGACNTNCKRKDGHVRPTAAINKLVHKFLDDCGVANSQA
jgi:hypothetical protein